MTDSTHFRADAPVRQRLELESGEECRALDVHQSLQSSVGNTNRDQRASDDPMSTLVDRVVPRIAARELAAVQPIRQSKQLLRKGHGALVHHGHVEY